MLQRIASRRLFLLILTVISSASFTTSARELDLSDIVKLGIKRSPIIKQDEANLEDAKNQTKEYKAAIFPTVYADLSVAATRTSGSVVDNGTPSNNQSAPASNTFGLGNEIYNGYIAASQPLYVGGLISAGIDLRTQTEQQQVLQNLSDTQTLVLNLVTAYFNVAMQQHLLHAADENVQMLDDYAAITKRYQKIGRARVTDKMQADINLITAKADQNSANSTLTANQETLRQLLALDEPPQIAAHHDLALTPIEKFNTSDAVAVAMRSNPDILVAEKQLEEIDNNKAVDLAADKPSLYLTGQVGYESPDDSTWYESSNYNSKVMLELKIPMFSGLSSIYKSRSYEEKKISSTRGIENQKLTIEAALKSQLFELQAAYDRLQIARQAAMMARDALDIGMKDYQRSLLTTQDILTLQTTRYAAQKLFIQTHFGYLTTLANVRKSMGINMEEIYGGQGNSSAKAGG